jgi:hypothetical protein
MKRQSGILNEVKEPFLYTGKKTEIIVVDSNDANKAINNNPDRISGDAFRIEPLSKAENGVVLVAKWQRQ